MKELEQEKKEIEDKKNEIFNKYNADPKWSEEKGEKIWEEIKYIENSDDWCTLKHKYSVKESISNKLKSLKNECGKNKSIFINKLKPELKEILWETRKLTEEIAREIIEDFDSVKIKEGKIYITVALPLGPFFKGKLEQKFQKLRLTDKWKEFIGYDEKEGRIKWPLYQNGIFSPDSIERELEKTCYDIKAFRGITYNEILTPIYKLERSNLCGIIQIAINYIDSSPSENLDDQKKEFFKCILRRVQELLTGWDIKVRITKGGLVNVFIEKEFKKTEKDPSCFDINIFAEEKRKLMINPYSDEELINIFPSNLSCRERIKKRKLLKNEQIITSYLNAAAIWITHIFLKESKCECEGKVAKFWRGKELKDPWDVKYKAGTSRFPMHDTPPLRNYFFAFHLKAVKGIGWGGKILTSEEHFDCPADIKGCPKREGDNCFIILFGHLLLALSTNTYVVRDNGLKRPWFTQKELENFAKRDLSRWRGELCFIDSETILICTPSDIEYINKEGQPVKYDDYWKSIIKGLSLLVSCKTLAMDISRLLFDCIRQHRHKTERTETILKRLDIISHLLSRTRFIATPSNISRARYIREKLEVYIKAIGLPEIVSNIEKDYDELDKAIHASIESKRNKQIFWLTFLLVPATILTAIGTVIMVCGIDITRIADIIKITCNETLKDYAIFALYVSVAFYIIAGVIFGGIVLWKKVHSIFKKRFRRVN